MEQLTHQLLRDHATHTDADEVDAPLFFPADKVEQLFYIFRHLARRVRSGRSVAPPNPSIVEDEHGVAGPTSKVRDLVVPGLGTVILSGTSDLGRWDTRTNEELLRPIVKTMRWLVGSSCPCSSARTHS